MFILNILFCFACSVFVKGNSQKSRKFIVEKDVQASPSIQPLLIFNTPSFHKCAAECSKNVDCCSASYGVDSSCKLYKCCFLDTISSIGGKHMRKRPFAEVSARPQDCAELPPGSDSGVYTSTIYPTENLQVEVYCDMGLESGTGWTVIQRRIDGSVNFNVDWEAYKTGFGDKNKEYWIGNDILNIMTTSKRYILRFDVTAYDGESQYAEYDVFSVEDESTGFTVSVGCHYGTADDTMIHNNGMKFSSPERDNDVAPFSCSAKSHGGWWFEYCSTVNPNGLYKPQGYYGDGAIYWRPFRSYYSLAAISMKIKPL